MACIRSVFWGGFLRWSSITKAVLARIGSGIGERLTLIDEVKHDFLVSLEFGIRAAHHRVDDRWPDGASATFNQEVRHRGDEWMRLLLQHVMRILWQSQLGGAEAHTR